MTQIIRMGRPMQRGHSVTTFYLPMIQITQVPAKNYLEDGLVTILQKIQIMWIDRSFVDSWADLLQRGRSNRTIIFATGIDWPLVKGIVRTVIFAMDLYHSDESYSLVEKCE